MAKKNGVLIQKVSRNYRRADREKLDAVWATLDELKPGEGVEFPGNRSVAGMGANAINAFCNNGVRYGTTVKDGKVGEVKL